MYYNICCKILGVKPGADLSEIKKAFRIKAKLYHPDLNSSPNAAAEFIRVKKAFDYLCRFKGSFTNRPSVTYNRSSYRKDPYYHASSFDWDKYRKMHNQQFHYTARHKDDIDFRSTMFGKIVFYFFHVLFLLAGIFIILVPLITLIKNGLDPDRSIVATIFAITGALLFGIAMVVMVVLSGLSANTHKKV